MSATRRAWSHYGRTMSKPSPSTPTHAGSTFSIKRGCGWMPAAATPVPEAGSAWGRPCRSNAGLRSRSSVHSRLRALGRCYYSKGALNYKRFALYLSRFLVSTLRSGDVLVLDNLAVRKIGGLREWLAQRGVQVLFLPPYSPYFSPTTSSEFMTQRFGV